MTHEERPLNAARTARRHTARALQREDKRMCARKENERAKRCRSEQPKRPIRAACAASSTSERRDEERRSWPVRASRYLLVTWSSKTAWLRDDSVLKSVAAVVRCRMPACSNDTHFELTRIRQYAFRLPPPFFFFCPPRFCIASCRPNYVLPPSIPLVPLAHAVRPTIVPGASPKSTEPLLTSSVA